MSVINKMLKDLEQRRAQGFDKNSGMLDDLDSASVGGSPKNRNAKAWVTLAFFLLIAIVSTWVYLEGYFQQAKVVVDAPTVPVVPIVRPEVKIYKSVVQEVLVTEEKPAESSDEKPDAQLGAKDINTVQDAQREKKLDLAAASEIKITGILPSPLEATGEREIITVNGSGFIDPLSITMAWNAGRASTELQPWQIKVISPTKIMLHVNLGKSEDSWQLLIKSTQNQQQAQYDFTVSAMLEPEVKLVEEAPEAKVEEPESKVKKDEVKFTKTNRTVSHEEQVAIAFSKASALMKQGRIRQAKESLHEVLTLDFSHLQARQTLASILFSEKNYDEAIEVLELGNIQHPDHVPFSLLLARIYTERGQDPLAIELLERQHPAVASNSEYFALLAALYQRSAQYSNAADVYKKLLVSFPSKAVWWMGLGLSLQSLEKVEDAITAYNKSLQTQGLSDELRRFVKTRIAQLTA